MTKKELIENRKRFNREGVFRGTTKADGKAGLIEATFVATRDFGSGEVRYDVTIPNAGRLVFPDDFPKLLVSFGFGIVRLVHHTTNIDDLGLLNTVEVVWKVEHLFKRD